jgi:polysaccharide biosynthesis protein PelF
MFAFKRQALQSVRDTIPHVDVCLIAEGSYPHVSGGVSTWADWLMRTQTARSYSVVSVVAGIAPRTSRFAFPPNLKHICELDLQAPRQARRKALSHPSADLATDLAKHLIGLIRGGGLSEFAQLNSLVNSRDHDLTVHDVVDSDLAFNVVRRIYDEIMPHASFLQFYWAYRALFGGLFAVLKFELPPADIYHSVCTGYAGLLAARATLSERRPAIVTEHGIYTNERRIEIHMAEWISDSVQKGVALDDERIDLRDVWISVFESYARICYEASAAITTLFQDNQHQQTDLGAAASKLLVIANGIDIAKFSANTDMPDAGAETAPCIALIGRVVPIKDVKTFIASVAIMAKRVPKLRALVLGPNEEDPGYFNECVAFVQELGLSQTVTFTGNVNILDYFASIQVVVLTSLSEAQPLVLLEAGAAGIPCVATNVGACREIIEGSSPADAPGGFVTDLVSPEQLAEAICRLLASPGLRERFGQNLRQRVIELYRSDLSRDKYSALYDAVLAGGAPRLPREDT